jgi:hypothetical protein
MQDNLWQMLMQLFQKRQQEEEERRMQAARNLSNGTNDNGMSLESMFRRFRPNLMDAWEGRYAPPRFGPDKGPPQLLFGNPTPFPTEIDKNPWPPT